MSNIFQKALSLLTGVNAPDEPLKVPKKRLFQKLTERELIQLESEVGRKLFGPIPDGHRREFFNLDAKTWIWHEEYKDAAGKKQMTTTRYEIKGDKILKAQDGAQYSYLEGHELANFTLAVQLYYENVMRGVYKLDPQTGQKFTA